MDADHRLGLQVLELFTQLRVIVRLQPSTLRDAFAVTQVDENDAAWSRIVSTQPRSETVAPSSAKVSWAQ